MSTSGRSESINSLFKGYVHSLTNLRDFVKRYEKALENRYEIEVRADFETSLMIEKKAAEAYTKTMFGLFDGQYLESLDCLVFHKGDDCGITCYHVRKVDTQKEHIVTCFNSETTISCSCKMFEFEGILSIKFAVEGVMNESFYEVDLSYMDEAFRKMKTENDKHDSSMLDMDSQESPNLTDIHRMNCRVDRSDPDAAVAPRRYGLDPQLSDFSIQSILFESGVQDCFSMVSFP
ncbi:hypothetical protein HHK36_020151 [Tetracentron sinense]|uniref:Protein FAR1-RELATED SEQUENCE n=1 Tax=Tetracentron sinense TaxID=13715 RepID=A0A835DBD0_TETSI|nr:hypothetical protein HHK36_020151 [Tetracentron sinense]